MMAFEWASLFRVTSAFHQNMMFESMFLPLEYIARKKTAHECFDQEDFIFDKIRGCIAIPTHLGIR